MDDITQSVVIDPRLPATSEALIEKSFNETVVSHHQVRGSTSEWDAYLQQEYMFEPAPSHLPQHKTAPSADVGWLDDLMASAV